METSTEDLETESSDRWVAGVGYGWLPGGSDIWAGRTFQAEWKAGEELQRLSWDQGAEEEGGNCRVLMGRGHQSDLQESAVPGLGSKVFEFHLKGNKCDPFRRF